MSSDTDSRLGSTTGGKQDAQNRFRVLFEQTHLPLLAYAVRRVANPADAADVIADVFLVAWRRIDEVPSGPDARPWMFGVARASLLNYYRGERRRTALADRLRHSLDATHLDEHPEGERLAVRDALATLTESDREIVQLAAWEQLSRAEIAVAMGCSPATVRVRLHRARTRLRKALTVSDQPESATQPVRPLGRTRPALQIAAQAADCAAPNRTTTRTSEETPCART